MSEKMNLVAECEMNFDCALIHIFTGYLKHERPKPVGNKKNKKPEREELRS